MTEQMYLHLGKGVVAGVGDILAICDLDNASSSHITREFLKKAQDAGEVVSIADELPKSFIVCQESSAVRRVYLSQLSSATLLRRSETGSLE